MPRVRVAWPDVWVGAIVTSMLFSIGRVLIGLYIGKAGLTSAFGAAGSLVVVLIWVYYSAQVFLLGAEFTWVYARTLGSQRPIADPAHATAAVAAAPEAAVRTAIADTPTDVPRRTQPLTNSDAADGVGESSSRVWAWLAAGAFAGVVVFAYRRARTARPVTRRPTMTTTVRQ